MSTDHVGHLGYARFDPEHPAHQATGAGDELLRVYERVDELCGELIEAAEAQYGEEPTVLLFSDHGMKPIYWMFHLDRWLEERGHLRFRKRSLQPWRRGQLDYLARVDQKLVRTVGWYGRALDKLPFLPRPAEDRLFADIDFGSTRAYGFASQGQLYVGELTGARNDPGYIDALAAELAEIPHPGDGRAGLRGAAQGGALVRAVPRQGARADAHPVRRADQRRPLPPPLDARCSSGTRSSTPRSRTATPATTA